MITFNNKRPTFSLLNCMLKQAKIDDKEMWADEIFDNTIPKNLVEITSPRETEAGVYAFLKEILP